jgi:fructokinase
MKKFSIVGLGEVLWDVFATHKQLGGAPANFAYICNLLGDEGVVASSVGADDLGDEVEQRLNRLGLSAENVQRDATHPTGTVKVEVASDGQPQFEFTQNVAWDFLDWTQEWQGVAARADAVCFGSLAQRAPRSRTTIQKFVAATRPDAVRVFDVNLRQSFYSAEVLQASASSADILKLNHEEFPVVMKAIHAPHLDELHAARYLCSRFALKLVCITRGAAGSLLVRGDEHNEHAGYQVKIADTVGAGDAFTATMVHHFLRGSDLTTMNNAANRMGAWVASEPGATPEREDDVIESARAW